MQVGEDFGAPADHLAVELAIMRHLVERTATRGRDGASSDAEGLRRQLEFLDRHLLRWVPQWAADVARGSTTDFYRSAAGMLDAFLQRDRASLRRALDGRPS
jgi:TorA-specific chaperone